MSHKISPQEVLDRVIAIAKERPDFVYTDQGRSPNEHHQGISECSYLGANIKTPDVGQSCIIGQAFQDLGMSRDFLRKCENVGPEFILLSYNKKKKFSETDRKIISHLGLIQNYQDIGIPWGEAVNKVLGGTK